MTDCMCEPHASGSNRCMFCKAEQRGARPNDFWVHDSGPRPAAPTFEYQILGARGYQLVTLKSFWAVDDHAARMTAGELDPGVVLVRMVERASPGRAGNL